MGQRGSTVERLDNVAIVVEDLDGAIAFFTALGLDLEGRAPIDGAWAGAVTGLPDMRVEIAMMRTPDGHAGSSSRGSSPRPPWRTTGPTPSTRWGTCA